MKGDEEGLNEYVALALTGDARALERLLQALKDPLFRLALRMLGNFADAEDATQEILVKVMTGLSSFERRSSLRTWAFRVAINHLHDVPVRRRATTAVSLDALAGQLGKGLVASAGIAVNDPPDPLLALEAREVGLHCVQGILMCLDVGERTAYVLSEVFDFDTRTAAAISGIGESAYRQRLSRGRRRLEAFMGEHCGLVNARAACRCTRQALALRRARKGKPLPIQFAKGEERVSAPQIAQARGELSRLQRIAVVFRDHPEWSAPPAVLENVRRILSTSPLLQPSSPSRFDS